MASPTAASAYGEGEDRHSVGATTAGGEQPATQLLAETPWCPEGLARPSWDLRDFRVLRLLGEGTSSSVLEARCGRSGLRAAIKCYPRERAGAARLAQARREVEVHASMPPHPAVVPLYAAFEDRDGLYLVSRLAGGGDLYAELTRRGGVLPEAEVASRVVRPLLAALAHLHTRGVLHRDVKPENVVADFEGGPYALADFGLALDTTSEPALSPVGTLDYLAPEIVDLLCAREARRGRGKRGGEGAPSSEAHAIGTDPAAAGGETAGRTAPSAAEWPNKTRAKRAAADREACLAPSRASRYGPAVDVWCVGALAYECLVGGPPFEARTREATLTRICKAAPFLPRHLSEGARSFLRAALAKSPAARPPASELARLPWVVGAADGEGGLGARAASVPTFGDAVSLAASLAAPSDPDAVGSPAIAAFRGSLAADDGRRPVLALPASRVGAPGRPVPARGPHGPVRGAKPPGRRSPLARTQDVGAGGAAPFAPGSPDEAMSFALDLPNEAVPLDEDDGGETGAPATREPRASRAPSRPWPILAVSRPGSARAGPAIAPSPTGSEASGARAVRARWGGNSLGGTSRSDNGSAGEASWPERDLRGPTRTVYPQLVGSESVVREASEIKGIGLAPIRTGKGVGERVAGWGPSTGGPGR